MSEETRRTPFGEDVAAEDGERPEGGDLAAEVQRLNEELAAKAAEAEQNRDAFLRERAELENFKKRMQREKGEALRYAAEPIVRELLPVIDNLERAVESAAVEGDDPLLEGVRLVLKSALGILENHGVRRIDAGGQSFDPHLHEAIAQVDHPALAANQVVEQYLPGYQLHERLLRPAQVSVATGAAEQGGEET
jgi:molecular chaperone GrpE